jgi:demethylmenaquinone methyltransferase/2-methoxy-6-polyprenyl-1,4-benzoquinol methylase
VGGFDRYGYGPVAAIYDELAAFYSRGRIGETKRLSCEVLKPGDRVLYPGVGRGEEVLSAVRLGAVVTGVDVSAAMLGRLRAGLEREEMSAELVQADVSTLRPEAPYDVIIANYFLNLFDASRAVAMLDHLADWLRPGGLLVVSDFARPSGGIPSRLVSELYYRPVNGLAWAFGLCALHPILDYSTLLDPEKFRIVSVNRLPVLSGQNPAYVSMVVERIAG